MNEFLATLHRSNSLRSHILRSSGLNLSHGISAFLAEAIYQLRVQNRSCTVYIPTEVPLHLLQRVQSVVDLAIFHAPHVYAALGEHDDGPQLEHPIKPAAWNMVTR
jgi:hypothetical protein